MLLSFVVWIGTSNRFSCELLQNERVIPLAEELSRCSSDSPTSVAAGGEVRNTSDLGLEAEKSNDVHSQEIVRQSARQGRPVRRRNESLVGSSCAIS
jgi:hypothetical protein